MRAQQRERRRWRLREAICGCAFFIASAGAASSSLPAAPIVHPADGSWVPTWESDIAIRYALENVIEGHRKCFALNGGVPACSPLAENSSVVLSDVAAAIWHELVATVQDESGATVSRESSRFFGGVSPSDPWGHSLLNMLGATAQAGEVGACVQGRSCPAPADVRAELFDEVYLYRVWNRFAPGAPLSGSGSTPEMAVGARRALEEAVSRDGVTSILDAPCGDLTWMASVDIGNARYLGADISRVVLEQNERNFPPEKSRFRFQQLDLVSDEWPAGYELILIRDLMYHQTAANNLAVLDKLERSGARFAVMSTHLTADDNDRDYSLVVGHRINLLRRPYCLRQPERLYADGPRDRYVGVWELRADVPLRDPSGGFCADRSGEAAAAAGNA